MTTDLEPEDLIEVAKQLAHAVSSVGRAITADGAPGHDAVGGCVISLTEAVMGITGGLCRVADSIDNLAEAVREHSK